MKLAWLFALSLLVLLSTRARASSPQTVVRGWFSALERQDFPGALKLTRGAAQARTAKMLGALARGAAEHHASVEVKVQKLEIATPPAALGGTVPVIASFDIEVVGRRWLFHKLARKLTGVARFRVAADQRIVAIDGNLE